MEVYPLVAEKAVGTFNQRWSYFTRSRPADADPVVTVRSYLSRVCRVRFYRKGAEGWLRKRVVDGLFKAFMRVLSAYALSDGHAPCRHQDRQGRFLLLSLRASAPLR